jgi:hypothetical protein
MVFPAAGQVIVVRGGATAGPVARKPGPVGALAAAKE